MDEHCEVVLAAADLIMARDQMAYTHQMFNDEAAKKGGKYLFRNEYVAAWQAFRDNPTIDTARTFLAVAPPFLECLEQCCPGQSFHSAERFLKDRGF